MEAAVMRSVREEAHACTGSVAQLLGAQQPLAGGPHLQQLLDLRLLRRLAGRVARRDGQVAERHTKPLGHDLQVCTAGMNGDTGNR